MPFATIWLILGTVALIVTMVCIVLWDARKQKKQIEAAFGKVPALVRGLGVARRFYAEAHVAQPRPHAVDDLTWNDLDMDSVFERINACQSAAGDAWLYAQLRRQPADTTTLAQREALIGLLDENPALRLKLQYRLRRLGRTNGDGMAMAVYHAEALRLKNRWVYALCALLPLFASLLFIYNVPAGLIATGLAIGLNLNIYAITKAKSEGRFGAVRFLASSLSCAHRLAELLAGPAPQLAAQLKEATRGLRKMRLPISVLTFDEMWEQAVGFSPTSLFLLPLLCYGSVAARLAGTGVQAEALYALLGQMDIAAAVLSWRKSLPQGWCHPQYTKADTLDCTGLYHPLLEDAVPNSVRFGQDVLLTGSNASGKSTFIKALALNIITAQALNTCTATRFALRPGVVASSMAVADSIVDGDSYFVAEIKSMRRLLRLVDNADAPFAYLFIDEILKGTNTVERVAASTAVLAHLHGGACLCFAATHDVELTSLLAGQYDNYHFRETVDETGVWFDYQLREGPATSRNAILLLQRMSFPKEVTDNARALAAYFEESGHWQ